VDIVTIAGLIVAVFGLPAVWIAWRTSRDAIRNDAFDKVFEFVQTHQPELRSVAWSASLPEWRSSEFMMLTQPGWIMRRPKDLECIAIDFTRNSLVSSREGRKRFDLRVGIDRARYTYSKALTARSAKLFNGIVYRPLHIQTTRRGLRISFTQGNYFDYLDSGEVLAYELGDRLLRHKRRPAAGTRRRSIADPFDLTSRPTSLGINTLTVRLDPSGHHSFYMHKRSGSIVVNEFGLVHVIPAGEFTPSNVSLEAVIDDFSIWRNIMREYAEEFLGIEESYGRAGKPLDYESDSPYRELSDAIDPLYFKPELLTICIFQAEVFDAIFASITSDNEEGVLLVGPNRRGIPFTASNIKLYADNKETAMAGAMCLKLAWRHRRKLDLE
jgi:hypothetical protein